MKTLIEIEEMLASSHVIDAFNELHQFLEKNPDNSKGWYLLGGIYRRQQLWGDAINAYNKSKMIDPEGPADAAIESIYDIIRFVNTDLMNP
jgi:cytochrome c-type biogenesis protein CcmH/NrfG